ncbi:hypothetical protein T265_11934 [Opisthorchis viverrini]|uniref:CUB domain-containing protein n=1 Tax=Opisthorchis viverrini TaxID=6198 RepID=A0A074Z7N1_OPIVI|nr:hypothetical protein T265_11934 [Opisthorchis viverrini]KER19220.1 hypothetical protein T265_11934 [Opisthorchis viverrini]
MMVLVWTEHPPRAASWSTTNTAQLLGLAGLTRSAIVTGKSETRPENPSYCTSIDSKIPDCQAKYVSVIEVDGTTETELGKWCGTEGDNAWLMSTGSNLLIRLRTDESVEGDYFEATYVSTNCQFEFSDSCSYIKSPPDEFLSNEPLKCLWRIQVPKDFQMRLQFKEFNLHKVDRALSLEGHQGLIVRIIAGWKLVGLEYTDNLVVISKNNFKTRTMLTKLVKSIESCGMRLPSSHTTNCKTNGLHILGGVSGKLAHIEEFCESREVWDSTFEQKKLTLFLDTNTENTHRMFKATCAPAACQFDLSNDCEYFTSPPVGFETDLPLKCLWRIRVPDKFQLRLQFQEFNVDGSTTNCKTNGLHIFGEVSGELAHITEFCGSKTSWDTTFEQKHLTLFLDTNAENTHNMFKATCAPENFQRTISVPTGDISFIGSKDKIPVLDAKWILKPMDGKRVILKFHWISLGGVIADCERNYVNVYDGETAGANLLGKYCGTIQPIPIASSGPHMLIHLHRTEVFTSDRFVAHHTSSNCIHEIPVSSGEISWPNGEIQETECILKLHADEEAPIDLRFQKMLVGRAKETCEGNMLEVYNGESTSCCLVKAYCGHARELVFLSSENKMELKLSNLKYRFGDQFTAEYEAPECQFTETEASGSFVGPPAGFEHTPYLRCLWKIIPTEGQSVSLHISNIQIGCNQGVVKVYEGTSGQLNEVGSYCGTPLDQTIRSSGMGLTVYLSTSVSAPANIFQGTYTIGK